MLSFLKGGLRRKTAPRGTAPAADRAADRLARLKPPVIKPAAAVEPPPAPIPPPEAPAQERVPSEPAGLPPMPSARGRVRPTKSVETLRPKGSVAKMKQPARSADATTGDILGALGRRKGLILLATLAAFIGALAFVNLVSPRYTAEARLLLENRDTYYSRPEKDGRGSSDAIDPEAVQSQVQVIGSRDLARGVIRKLNLGASPEFDPVLKGIPSYVRALILIGIVRDPTLSTPEERVLESYSNKVSISAVGKSRVIGIEVTTLDPDLAAKIANAIAQDYLALQTEAKKQNTQIASSWLNQTIEPLRRQVIEADAKVEAYRSKNNLYLGPNNTTISTQQLADLSTQLATARAGLAEQQAKAQTIREALKNGRVFDISDVLKDDLIRRLSENRSNLRALYASESKVYFPQHPRLRELSAQISDLEAQIRGAAERTARSLENDVKAGTSRVTALQAEIDGQKKIAALASDDDVTLKALEREAKALRDQLETYQAKAIDANARDSSTGSPADARIVSIALSPSIPSFPKSVPIVTLATLAALILSSFLVVAGELLRLQAAAEPMRMRIDPVVAVPVASAPAPVSEALPVAAPEPGVAAPEPAMAAAVQAKMSRAGEGLSPQARMVLQPDAPFARSIRALADRALVARRHLSSETASAPALQIVVASAEAGQGATSVAIGLARLLASEGRAVLIDLNDDAPGLDALVSHTEGHGLSDLIEGVAAFGDAIHRDRGSRLHILPFGLTDAPVRDAELLPKVLEALRQSYDFVVIDTGVAQAMPEVLKSSGMAVLVATGEREAPRTEAAYRHLSGLGLGNVAVFFNEIDMPGRKAANDAEPAEPLAMA